MANKAFEIQNSTLRIGGVDLQAGSNSIVIPGVTQATNYFVEEVDDIDGNNPDTFGSDPSAVTVIDNAEYLYRSGIETPSNLYSAAGYSIDEIDDGEIDKINVEAVGTFLDSDRLLILRDNMWATTVIDPYTNFNANDWTQIPFKPKMRAGEVENVGGGEGLPTIIIPEVLAGTYKGLQVSYGVVHSNNNSNELNVNKIVIHKPVITTVTIDSDGGISDDFQVSGLGASDILAMFVVYGNVNEAKPIGDLQAFAQAVIDFVILIDGAEGEFRTVDAMKAAFYDNYPTLTVVANGLHTNFQFYAGAVPTLNGGVTTVREGSGAVFEIRDLGDGTYQKAGVLNPGTNYQSGHKIRILGTDLGGVTPDNDCIITIDTAVGGEVFLWNVTGTAAGSTQILYSPVTGTNIDMGSGFTAIEVYKYNNGVGVSNWGTGYVVGDVITLSGSNITGGNSPANDITITVTGTGGNGEPYGFVVTGTVPALWPTNSIEDGGENQYATGNYINTNLASEISYNNGETVIDGAAAFGTDSTYTFVYDTAIFGLFVTGSSATSLSTSGSSGADGESITETGSVFGNAMPEQTFENAVTHINIIGGEENDGIRFSDGTILTSAEGIGRVKLESPGNRRIEEVYGYKQVSVTARTIDREFTGLTLSPTLGPSWDVFIDGNVYSELYAYVGNFQYQLMTLLINGTEYNVEPYINGSNIVLYATSNNGGVPVSYSEGDFFTVTKFVGADPVVWWDKNELPGGSTNFRGAIIDYHAFTGESTIIGTIHIVDDDGEEYITHTEVASGSTDGENDYLWLVTTEGQIRYRRIDQEEKTLKIQWSAKVFYGSETYD